jgi:hypothetical protein
MKVNKQRDRYKSRTSMSINEIENPIVKHRVKVKKKPSKKVRIEESFDTKSTKSSVLKTVSDRSEPKFTPKINRELA